MTWESTGDKRIPKKGEFAHCNLCERIHECEDPSVWGIAIIMRPVQEPKEPIYQVVLTIPPEVSNDMRQKVAESWVGFILRSNPRVKPEIRKVYANE